MSEALIELVAVQAFMRTADYRDENAFVTKIASLTERIAAARARDTNGEFRHPALVVFPEHIGTFLSVTGYAHLLRPNDDIDKVLRRVVLHRPLGLVAAMFTHRTLSFARAVLLAESVKMHRVYRRAFHEAARRLAATVVAGSIVLPDNAAGIDAETLEPLGNRLYNSSYTFDPEGRCVDVTRKVNLVPTQEDVLPLARGEPEALAPIESACGRIGVMICYDGFSEPHTSREPGFCALGERLAAAGVEIVAQPSANAWPWNERWVFCDVGEDQLRREQWLREGLFSQLPHMPGVRYAVNPQLIGNLLGNRFDGRSYIFARASDGHVRIVATAAADALAETSEEILVARVPLRPLPPPSPDRTT